MKQKTIVITAILLLATLMATPFITLAHAQKTVIPFSTYIEVSGTPGSGIDANQKTSQDEDEHLLNRWGTYRDILFNIAVVGSGRMYLTTLRSITNYEVEPSTPGAVEGAAKGHGIYKVQIEIKSGPRTGATLEGFAIMTWEWDFTVNPPVHIQTASYTLMQGTGAFEGARLDYETMNKLLPSGLYGFSREGELVLP